MRPIAERIIHKVLARADIQLNGQRPWDIIVHDKRLLSRVARKGSWGFGEAYMDGWKSFDAHWPNIKKKDAQFDERFYRMWQFYLLSFAGYLRARRLHQWQIVLTPRTRTTSYQAVR